MNDDRLDELVKAVAKSVKYRDVSPDLIREIGQRELSIRPSLKTAIKATKSKLHQVAGAYHTTPIDYGAALDLLHETVSSPPEFRDACREIMRSHASTRERLPILDEFFMQTLAELPPVHRVMDIGCGLNPLAWPWMPLGDDVEYLAFDIYEDEMWFLAGFMKLAGIKGYPEVRDVLYDPPTQPVDLILLLKTLPCLEQIDKMASTRLLDAIQARYLLISYPVTSLGGRSKGMITNYEAHFDKLALGRPWSVQPFIFATEMAFFVTVEGGIDD